jgi:hypothetical protein
VRQPDAAREAFQEGKSEVGLENGKLFGNRRLADREPFGAAADASHLGDGAEDSQVVEVQAMHKSYIRMKNYVFDLYREGWLIESKGVFIWLT